MKKYTTTIKFRLSNKKRSENREKRKDIHKNKVTKSRVQKSAIKNTHKRNLSEIVAPPTFSFIDNPDEICKFIDSLEMAYSKRNSVYVNLSNVTSVDHTAVTVMMAALIRFRAEGIDFNGNYPMNKELQQFINRIFGTLYQTHFNKKDEYVIHEDEEYGIYTHAKKKVDSELTSKLVLESSKMVWGESRRCLGVQSSLIELMHNTNNHADPTEIGQKHWWLSVNRCDTEDTISFVFLDFGIGIIESLNGKPQNNKWYLGWQNLKNLWFGDALLLDKILAGDLHRTVTDLSFRGKGLAHISKAYKRNQLNNLCVISNRAYCNYKNNQIRNMDKAFSGTLIYWEVNPTTQNYTL